MTSDSNSFDASILDDNRFSKETIIRRAINANLRVGTIEALDRVLRYATNEEAPEKMRAEALETIRTWAEPSVHDRVDGRYRGVVKRDKAPVKNRITSKIDRFLDDSKPSVVISAIQTVGEFGINESTPKVLTLMSGHKKSSVRSEALLALKELNYPELKNALSSALADKSKKVRATALSIIPESELEEESAVSLLETMYTNGTRLERQSVLASLAKYSGNKATQFFSRLFTEMKTGDVEKELHLDILEGIRTQNNEGLLEQLSAFESSKEESNPLALYEETLYGGSEALGEKIFYEHEAAQCVRCHSIYEWGGDAGPGLQGLSTRLDKNQILESLIEPSATIAIGYAVVSLELANGESLVAPVANETDTSIQLRLGKNELRTVSKTEITEREDIPSSMPGVKNILSKMEIRDLVAFLNSIELEES